MLLAYVDPDTIMPITSGLAAATGFLILTWRFIVRCVQGTFRCVFRNARKPASSSHPISEACCEENAAPQVAEPRLVGEDV